MSWTCPNMMKDDYCAKLKRECKPGSKGCVLANKKFKFVGEDDGTSKDKGPAQK